MKTQLTAELYVPDLSGPRAVTFRLQPGHALRLGRRGGELRAVDGRVWLTRRGDLQDHLLLPGDGESVAAADDAVVESWAHGEAVTLHWRPQRRQALRLDGTAARAAAAGLRGLAALAGRFAAGLRDAEAGLAALARTAAASACRAQGCIASGDSIASSGALK